MTPELLGDTAIHSLNTDKSLVTLSLIDSVSHKLYQSIVNRTFIRRFSNYSCIWRRLSCGNDTKSPVLTICTDSFVSTHLAQLHRSFSKLNWEEPNVKNFDETHFQFILNNFRKRRDSAAYHDILGSCEGMTVVWEFHEPINQSCWTYYSY